MNILVLNGSPRKHGNTAFMIDAFLDGAKQQGHHVDVISVCEKNINGCLACEYCHTKGNLYGGYFLNNSICFLLSSDKFVSNATSTPFCFK